MINLQHWTYSPHTLYWYYTEKPMELYYSLIETNLHLPDSFIAIDKLGGVQWFWACGKLDYLNKIFIKTYQNTLYDSMRGVIPQRYYYDIDGMKLFVQNFVKQAQAFKTFY